MALQDIVVEAECRQSSKMHIHLSSEKIDTSIYG
jgi:hypothetical protein